MANNYCQSSESYDLNPEQVKWFEDLLALCREYDGLEEDKPDDKVKLDRLKAIFGSGLADDCGEALSHFELSRNDVWIHEEECVNINMVITVLQAMLRETNDSRVLTGTWADTCSKPRAGEFGGGWFAVSAKKSRTGDTYAAAAKAAVAMKKP